jgi:hypothetical protein
MAPSFTAEQKLQCLEREIARRRRVFPNRVHTGRLSVGTALQELDCMRAIRDDYRILLQKERLL